MIRMIKLRTCWLLLWLLAPWGVSAQSVFTLEDALRQAEAQNYDIRLAVNDVAIARADYSMGNAGFLPTVNASAGYNGTISSTDQSFLSGQTNEVNGALTTRTSAGVNMSWSLFEGLGRNATLDRLRQEFEQQEQTAFSTRETVIADVTVLYYDLVPAATTATRSRRSPGYFDRTPPHRRASARPWFGVGVGSKAGPA